MRNLGHQHFGSAAIVNSLNPTRLGVVRSLSLGDVHKTTKWRPRPFRWPSHATAHVKYASFISGSCSLKFSATPSHSVPLNTCPCIKGPTSTYIQSPSDGLCEAAEEASHDLVVQACCHKASGCVLLVLQVCNGTSEALQLILPEFPMPCNQSCQAITRWPPLSTMLAYCPHSISDL